MDRPVRTPVSDKLGLAWLLRARITLIWLLLVAATLLSWALGHDADGTPQRLAAAGILIVTFVKVRFVMLDFMELRRAPRLLRGLAEGWAVLICAVLIGLLWLELSGPAAGTFRF